MKKILLIVWVSALLLGCTQSPNSNPAAPTRAATANQNPVTNAAAGTLTLTGAGSTFIYPLMSKWSEHYNAANPNIQINYQSIGSGAGIKQIMARTVDFGASDAPLSNDEYQSLTGILQIPESIGAVVVAYNIAGIDSGLNLTGPILSAIYQGNITQWNDPEIVKQNPGVSLPHQPIVVAHRSDGSGTTYVFTDYLSSVSPTWKSQVGKAKSVNWPVGLGGKGNEGIAGLLKQNPYAIGYVELAYAQLENIPYANIQDHDGQFVRPTLETTAKAAAAAVPTLPAGDANWVNVTIVNAPGKQAYPLASFTYLLAYRDQADATKGKALAEFMQWAVHDGQQYASDLGYVPLPDAVIKLDEKTLQKMQSNGKALIENG